MIEEFEYNGKAMGTNYSIVIVCDNKALAYKMFEIAKNEIEEYEARFSRFILTSELSVLNKRKSMVVSSIFFDVIQKAYQLFSKTKGIFNPLVSVSRFGYGKSFPEISKIINQNNNLDEENYDIDFSSVEIDKDDNSIYLNENQNLDYGGFLKGYLAQVVAQKIQSQSALISGIIINIGGDIHTIGLDKNGNKFIFNIYNPILKNNEITVSLYNQSLATSGTYKRSWFNLGRRVHHILDATGRKNPESDIVSVSIICDDGGESEAYTKVFFSLSPEKAMELLDKKDLKFVIIKNNGEVINNIK